MICRNEPGRSGVQGILSTPDRKNDSPAACLREAKAEKTAAEVIGGIQVSVPALFPLPLGPRAPRPLLICISRSAKMAYEFLL